MRVENNIAPQAAGIQSSLSHNRQMIWSVVPANYSGIFFNHVRSQYNHTYDDFFEAIWINKIIPSGIQPVLHCHRRLFRKTGQHQVQYDEMVKYQNSLQANLEYFVLLDGGSLPRP